MRLSHSLVLAHMLLRFFGRRVLRVGVLRSTAVRVVAAILVVAILVTCSVAAYAFLRPVAGEDRTWQLLFQVATVSALLWVQIGFLVVKTLFLNAGGLLEITYHLPLTNRERAAAFMVYEAVMCSIVAGAGFFAISVAAVALLGPAVVPRLLESIVFPVLLGYLVLTALYLVLARLCRALGLRRIENVALILVLFALLLAYTTRLPLLTTQATSFYLDGEERFVAVAVLPWISAHAGTWVMLLVAFTVAAALVVLNLALTPNQPTRTSRFVNLRPGPLGRFVDPYGWFLLRSTQTGLAASVAWALFAYLLITSRANPLWALCVASMGGLYQFAATAPLRTLPGRRRSAWGIYAALLRAQAVLLCACFVPAVLIVIATGAADARGIVFAVLGAAGGAVLAVCIGIVFPAENDNPFSVFIGLTLTGAMIAVIGIALGVLQLPKAAVAGCLVAAMALFVWYSVEGIRASESRRRHEEGTVGREQRRRSRDSDSGAGSGSAAVPHVHHA